MSVAQYFLIMLPLIAVAKISKQRILPCDSDEGISCKCAITNRSHIALLNCTAPSEWTSWSNWSSCERKLFQRRRRRCESPLSIDMVCLGEKVQTRKCDQTQLRRSNTPVNPIDTTLPEFVWGSWSDWNEWGVCSCPANRRERTRHCIGLACSGCEVGYSDCERPCVTERWWTDWSGWVRGSSNIRFRSWCSLSADGRSLVTVQLNETASIAESFGQWSDWKIRPGVAFRYRLPPELSLPKSEAAVDIQYQLLISASPTRVTLSFCLYLSALTMISGFFAQCMISKLFTSCRTSKTFL